MGKHYIQPEALKTPRKMLQTWPGWADKNFQGGTKIFSTIVEKFYPKIKIFRGAIFFFTGLQLKNPVDIGIHVRLCNL